MKSDLNLLIEMCEDEKRSLESSIKSYLDEDDYLYAHYHQKALWQVNHQLQVLNNFKDPAYNAKQHLEHLVRIRQKSIDSVRMNDYWQKRIDNEADNIKKIEEQGNSFNDSQFIDDALFDLYEGRHKKFRLYLNTDEDLYLDFELIDPVILLISLKINDENFVFDNDNRLYSFKGVGFKLNEKADALVYEHSMINFKDALAIKILLARIVYDFRWLIGNAMLVYDK
ncbi:hypothetical protein [Mucilaginibacter pocheonensis]|uniref:Uncharacterized protein n=1 Tax=Mucilaginibacter pocheonensis TaxID=398050 RepID=A0ABU1TD60_9SPHI|nr:hypothetical protein [Mucilaginibacter pocheonensis]MDR6943259.1 hypothetical protein [Mucilaginibacter pocheonensis]